MVNQLDVYSNMADALIPLGGGSSDVGGDIPNSNTVPQTASSDQPIPLGSQTPAPQPINRSGDVLIPLTPPSQQSAVNPIGTAQNGGANADGSQGSAPITPYNFSITDPSNINSFKQAAVAAGIDASKVPDSTWQNIQDNYIAARTPPDQRTLYQSYLVMKNNDHGLEDGMQSVVNGTIVGPSGVQIPPEVKAQQLFHANLVARELDGGKDIDAYGNYIPSGAYRSGQVAMGGMLAATVAKVAAPVASAVGAAGTRVGIPTAINAVKNASTAFSEAHPIISKGLQWGTSGAIGLALPQGYKHAYDAFAHLLSD